MKIIDVGSGVPVVVVPGVQGRWEWMKPGIDALARHCRVITFSLVDEPTCQGCFDVNARFSCYVTQIADALDQAGVEQASICGVSYGGLIAAAFAARHPERALSLALVSPIPPSWAPDRRVRMYLRFPRLLSPLFVMHSLRLYREIAVAAPAFGAGVRMAVHHGWNVLTHMFSPGLMARRVRWLASVDIAEEVARLEIPTLLITGDDALEQVVPVRASREYVHMWPHAQVAILDHTGHLGMITRPEEFARALGSFVDSSARDAAQRRRVV